MGFDLQQILRLVGQHGPLVRVVVADVAGSAPREVGAAMCVWATGQDGTIGGGALEHQAATAARTQLATGVAAKLVRQALGPALNQCCGGAVTLLSERWDMAGLMALDGPIVARPLPGKDAAMPLALHRLLARARAEGQAISPRILQGWFAEPLAKPQRDIWIWGAGHVGRAIAATLAPLPDLKITLVDTDRARFPDTLPDGVVARVHPDPVQLVADAPAQAEHLVLTFSHALDLGLCHALLSHGFNRIGLIGSATKWARFRSRLQALGHAAQAVDQITCPIGDPALGKHPQAIAISVGFAILRQRTRDDSAKVALNDRSGEGRSA